MKVAILGGTSGIGAALCEQLVQRADCEALQASYCKREPGTGAWQRQVQWRPVEPTSEPALKAWLESIGDIDWLINCVGYLHDQHGGPEKTITQFDPEHFTRSLQINTLPTLLLAKHARPRLKVSERAVFATVSARVGSISDNALGGWYSYRASKAALNMSLKCLAIEWQRNAKGIRVLALHPGTTDTRLSEPFQANVPAGKLFSPATTAAYLVQRLEEAHAYPSGRFVAYDGQEIGW